ncbi:MAG: hypothetical protein R3B90_19540 [Planctomycetaceae bacterium]
MRHKFKAWILWDQLVIFTKNAGATLYWWVVAACVFLPVIIILVLFMLYGGDIVLWYFEKIDVWGAWVFSFIMDSGEGIRGGLFLKILYSMMTIMLVAPIAAVFSFLMAFPAFFMMRANGLYGLYRRETLDLVTQVHEGQKAGFWVRFLCRAVDYTIINVAHMMIFLIPDFLVFSGFPLALYFGARLWRS